MHMLGSPKPNNGEPMRRLLIFIISLLLSTYFLFTFSIFDGEMTGDRGKNDQENNRDVDAVGHGVSWVISAAE